MCAGKREGEGEEGEEEKEGRGHEILFSKTTRAT